MERCVAVRSAAPSGEISVRQIFRRLGKQVVAAPRSCFVSCERCSIAAFLLEPLGQQSEDPGWGAGPLANFHRDAKDDCSALGQFISVCNILENDLIGAEPLPMHREVFGVAGVDAGCVNRDSNDIAAVEQIFDCRGGKSRKPQMRDIAEFVGSEIELLVGPIPAPS
jgi:hypothetical protein